MKAYGAIKGRNKGIQVLVKWVGYDVSENTWVLLSNQLRDVGKRNVQEFVHKLKHAFFSW